LGLSERPVIDGPMLSAFQDTFKLL
jgi:hypothetical protein